MDAELLRGDDDLCEELEVPRGPLASDDNVDMESMNDGDGSDTVLVASEDSQDNAVGSSPMGDDDAGYESGSDGATTDYNVHTIKHADSDSVDNNYGNPFRATVAHIAEDIEKRNRPLEEIFKEIDEVVHNPNY